MILPPFDILLFEKSPFGVFFLKMADEEHGVMQNGGPQKRKKDSASETESTGKKRKIDLSNVRNKLRRQQLFMDLKHEKNKEKREKRKKQRKDDDWESVCKFDCFLNYFKYYIHTQQDLKYQSTYTCVSI